MNSKRLLNLLFFILLTGPSYLRAQTNPYGEVSIASPTAASLGKYADIPVSYHTGIPQINMPIYTVKSGPLELPVGLSYHASGLKVLETSSWVGAGWSLDAGGAITRTVMGLPDEKGTGSGMVDVYGYFTDSGYNKYLYQDGADQDWLGFSAGRKDGEPDLFFFNFGGYSGKFFFRDDHTPILVPQQDLTIVPYFPNPGTTSIQGFIVTTPDGTRYYFGNTPNVTGTAPVEITNPYSQENGYSSGTVISSWFLNKITSPDSLFSITLNYVPENYGYYTISSTPLDPLAGTGLNPASELNLVKNIISGVRLNKINFPNGTIDFLPGQIRTDLSDNGLNALDNINTSATTLGSINISNTSPTNPFCKKFNFYYGYFIDNTTPQPSVFLNSGFSLQSDKSRLRLDSVREMSCDNLLPIPARKFTYFSEKVPRRITLGQDHWGFYNAADTNKTLIPTYKTYDGTNITPVYGANREAAWPAMRGGSLHQMTYPTGGSTVFDFEAADSYPESSPYPAVVQIPPTVFINTFGSNNSPQSYPFTSNGNPISFTTFNKTTDFQAKFYITNLNDSVVYGNQFFGDNNYPTGQSSTLPSVTLLPGNYIAYISFPAGTPGPPSNPPPGDEADVKMYQIDTLFNNYTVTIGGLRIKTITHSDSANSSIPIITNYSYPDGGFLYSFPTYVEHLRNDLITNLGYWDAGTNSFIQGLGSNNGCPLSGSYFLRSGGSLRPMATTQGYHIGYPRVIVSQTGNGSSEYNYYTSNSGFVAHSLDPTAQTIDVRLLACEPNTPNYPAAPLSFDYKKGELYFERHFNQAGDLLKDAYYYPEFDTASLQPAPGFIVVSRANPNGSGQILFGTLYNIFSPRRTKLHTVETNYTPGLGGVKQDTYVYYGSNFHNQVTRKVTTTSTGDSLITITKYSPDFHLASWDPSPSCETTYNNACSTCLANYVHVVDSCDNACTVSFLTENFLSYRKCLSDARNNYVTNRYNNYFKPNTNYYKTHHDATKSTAGTELKPILDLQDSGRIVPIEISDFRDTNLLKANFTRYDYTPGLSNIPFPNKTQLVNLQSPGSTFTNAVISGTTLTKDSRYLDETTYSFLKGNPARITGHDGLVTTYIWDYFNTNPISKTVSATTDSTAFSSFEADGAGNWNLTNGGGSTSQVNVTVNATGSNINLFPTQTPASLTQNDNQPTVGQELGVKFTSAAAGTITGIRFYKTSGNTGTHIGELYSSTGTRLAQATFTGETATGWQTVLFSTPVSITANTTYTAAYFSSLGNFVEDDYYFLHNPVSNSPLNAFADGTDGSIGADPGNGQGTYLHTSTPAFPNQLYEAANYWVDPIFSPGSTPYANAGNSQTITLPVSSAVLNGSGSTGTISSYTWNQVSGPNTSAITTPAAAFTTVTNLIQGVYVFQLSLNSGASTSQVTINVQAAGTPMNIFTSQATPTGTITEVPLELGVKFRSTEAGSITGIRFYKTTGNTGTHIGELYAYPSGTRLAQATFTGESASGWQSVTFSSPIAITPNTTYIAAYWSGSGNYAENSHYFVNALSNGPISALADGTDGHNSIYKYSGTPAYPNSYTGLSDQPNYWVDVLFSPDNTPIPNAGSNLVVTLPVSTVTLNGSSSMGTVSNYLWTKVSGPGTPTIVSPTSLITNVTGLSAGNYVFQLAINGASNSAYALTGTKSYNLTGNTISKSGLTSGKKYILSYWSRGAACSVSGATTVTSTGRSTNGWTYYQHLLTMTSTTLTVTGSNYIDELRLYPQGAQMSSYTYKPLAGITSMNDPNSEITFYEYDGLARLKNIKDYQGNIIKNFQYNYVDLNACGPNCFIVAMQTFAGTNTLSYPVGVFNLNGKLLGNATNQSQYISLWMTDTANSNTGTISAGPDSMQFRFTVNSGRSLPGSVTGLRYYQFDLPYTNIDGLRYFNAAYVDFGDGTGMKLGGSYSDSNVVRAPNTFINPYSYSQLPSVYIYWNHTYPDSSLKALTFYHNDGTENFSFDNGSSPASSLTHLKNLRGNLPQNTTAFAPNCFQQASALTVASIQNWNSIGSILDFGFATGDQINACLNLSYSQDFMSNNRGLRSINTTRGYYNEGYEDTTFKLSKLKTNWNTYFTNINYMLICDDHWSREDLTGLTHLSWLQLFPGNRLHSHSQTGNSLIPIPTSAIDNILNQIAAGAGQYINNGSIYIYSAGPSRSSASDAAVNLLISKGWTVVIDTSGFGS